MWQGNLLNMRDPSTNNTGVWVVAPCIQAVSQPVCLSVCLSYDDAAFPTSLLGDNYADDDDYANNGNNYANEPFSDARSPLSCRDSTSHCLSDTHTSSFSANECECVCVCTHICVSCLCENKHFTFLNYAGESKWIDTNALPLRLSAKNFHFC